ncbi:unnamed protein product [Heligmosomoides polygyrus]|uniref:BLOC-1-related complex subunit 7 n=1 Tax=Heligmosomoides polygyrus TaxID=6339 RepID=A0A183FPZ3_HELPZ|nr:unnamed protein product [Heligmosomoides polygyrus]
MTTIGSIKAQVTKAAKALRASMDEAEKLRMGQVPSNAPAVHVGQQGSLQLPARSVRTVASLPLHLRRDPPIETRHSHALAHGRSSWHCIGTIHRLLVPP